MGEKFGIRSTLLNALENSPPERVDKLLQFARYQDVAALSAHKNLFNLAALSAVA